MVNLISDALLLLEDDGIIKHPRMMADGAFCVESKQGWGTVCATLSRYLGGQFWERKNGATWQHGAACTVYILDHDGWADVLQARAACDRLGIQGGYSVASCARACVEMLGEGERYRPTSAALLGGIKLGYHDCKPGRYRYGVLHDVSSCYYQLLRRLPSLHPSINKGEIHWHATEPAQWERWQHMMQEVEPAKALRNSIWGAMLGKCKRKPIHYWHQGHQRDWLPPRGAFHTAALLIGRTAWELNRQASQETNAVYSKTDCIISLGPMPNAWKAVGLFTRVKAEGKTHVCARDAYRCGDLPRPKVTHLYKQGHHYNEPVARAMRPRTNWTARWL